MLLQASKQLQPVVLSGTYNGLCRARKPLGKDEVDSICCRWRVSYQAGEFASCRVVHPCLKGSQQGNLRDAAQCGAIVGQALSCKHLSSHILIGVGPCKAPFDEKLIAESGFAIVYACRPASSE